MEEHYNGDWSDLCSMCNEGGRVWLCYHCERVAHAECLDKDPDTHYIESDGEMEWCCAHCFEEHGYQAQIYTESMQGALFRRSSKK